MDEFEKRVLDILFWVDILVKIILIAISGFGLILVFDWLLR